MKRFIKSQENLICKNKMKKVKKLWVSAALLVGLPGLLFSYSVEAERLDILNTIERFGADHLSDFIGKEKLFDELLYISEMERAINNIRADWEINTAEDVLLEMDRQQDKGLAYYVIQWGDTLAVIAKAVDLPLEVIMEHNNLTDPEILITGDILDLWSDTLLDKVKTDSERSSIEDNRIDTGYQSVVSVAPLDNTKPEKIIGNAYTESTLEETTVPVEEPSETTEETVESSEEVIESTLEETTVPVEETSETTETTLESSEEVTESTLEETTAPVEEISETTETTSESSEEVTESTLEETTAPVEEPSETTEETVESSEEVIESTLEETTVPVEESSETTETTLESSEEVTESTLEETTVPVEETSETTETTLESSEEATESTLEETTTPVEEETSETTEEIGESSEEVTESTLEETTVPVEETSETTEETVESSEEVTESTLEETTVPVEETSETTETTLESSEEVIESTLEETTAPAEESSETTETTLESSEEVTESTLEESTVPVEETSETTEETVESSEEVIESTLEETTVPVEESSETTETTLESSEEATESTLEETTIPVEEPSETTEETVESSEEVIESTLEETTAPAEESSETTETTLESSEEVIESTLEETTVPVEESSETTETTLESSEEVIDSTLEETTVLVEEPSETTETTLESSEEATESTLEETTVPVEETSETTETTLESSEEVSVVVIEFITESYKETYSLATEYRPNNNMVIGDEKEVQAAIPGEKEITVKIQYIDGLEVSREVINEVIITPAQAQIVEQGTAEGTIEYREYTRDLKYERIRIDNPDLPLGREVITQDGVNGTKIDKYKIITINGKVTLELYQTDVIQESIPRITEVGMMPIDDYNAAYTEEVKRLINEKIQELRMINGIIEPLVEHELLNEAAQIRADENSQNDKMGHNYTIDGVTYSDKQTIAEVGYPSTDIALMVSTNLATKSIRTVSNYNTFDLVFDSAENLASTIINDWYVDLGTNNLNDGHRKAMLTPFMEDLGVGLTFKKTLTEDNRYVYRYDVAQMYGTTSQVNYEEFVHYLSTRGYFTDEENVMPTLALNDYQDYLMKKQAEFTSGLNGTSDPVLKDYYQQRLDDLNQAIDYQSQFDALYDEDSGLITPEQMAMYDNHKQYYDLLQSGLSHQEAAASIQEFGTAPVTETIESTSQEVTVANLSVEETSTESIEIIEQELQLTSAEEVITTESELLSSTSLEEEIY